MLFAQLVTFAPHLVQHGGERLDAASLLLDGRIRLPVPGRSFLGPGERRAGLVQLGCEGVAFAGQRLHLLAQAPGSVVAVPLECLPAGALGVELGLERADLVVQLTAPGLFPVALELCRLGAPAQILEPFVSVALEAG